MYMIISLMLLGKYLRVKKTDMISYI